MVSEFSANSPTHQGDWPAPTPLAAGGGFAQVRIPGSKSLTNRYLILAALAKTPSILHAPLHSRDSALMIEALEKLGARVERIATGSPHGDDLKIYPIDRQAAPKNVTIDCGLAGTVMRFVPPLATLLPGSFSFDGDPHARKRPLAPVIQALGILGAEIPADQNALPFTMQSTGEIATEEITIDASASSQFLSALLLIGASCPQGLTIHHRGAPIPSMPHVEMTVEVLRQLGIPVTVQDNTWILAPTDFPGFEVTVEPDLSNAGPFLAAATILGCSVRIPDWPSQTTQGGNHWLEVLPLFGAQFSLTPEGLTVSGSGQPQMLKNRPLKLDLAEAGELAPTVAALCALSSSPSTLTGIAHLRGHETDRLAALTREINRLGGQAQETEDGISILAPVSRAGLFHTYDDHRMATAAAIIGLCLPGTTVENIDTTSKTLPHFPLMWTRMIRDFEESAPRHA